MTAKVDLRAVPYELDDSAIKWVEDTIASMTEDEKIGQLFVNMGASRDPEYLEDFNKRYHIGAVRYNPGDAAEVQEQNRVLQTTAKIPLLIAANTEAGGNGACKDGTTVGFEVKVAATNDPHWAYELGRVSGVEASAIGCNMSFAPIVDINTNWRNPIIQERSFSSDPDLVLAMGKAYMDGISESGILATMKHFPGDGVDERDQHLSSSVNSLSTEEWDKTFGKVYSGMIEHGVPAVMAGHIMMPAYQRHFTPDTKDEDLLPATLCPELITDLLKGKLGFNGLVVTDASHMVGMTGAMARRDLVPAAIAAGCDLFLFFNDPDEDFGFMRDAVRSGVISAERLEDALRRILGLKARIGLHAKKPEDIVPGPEALERIGMPENKEPFKEITDRAITLVKNVQPDILPVTPERYKRILIVPVKSAPNPSQAFFGGKKEHSWDRLAEHLRAAGHEVEIFVSRTDEILAMSPEEQAEALRNMYAGKSPISEFAKRADLVINVVEVSGKFQPVSRVGWPASKGTWDIPWYVHEIPTIMVSFTTPYMLADAPAVKCYINAYDDEDFTVETVAKKLAEGAEAFIGQSPVDAFCGMVDTRI